MGLDDWKNKEPKDYTAEDFVVSGAEAIPWGNFICLSFYWKEYRFELWECWDVYLYSRDEKEKHIEHVSYDNCVSAMLDKHWDGLSLSDIMSKIPYTDLF